MSNLTLLLWVALAALAIIVLAIAVRFQRTTIYDYQRGLRYRDGRFSDLVEPGAHWTFGPTTFIRIVDMRTSVLPIAGQELVTSDGVTVKVSLAVQRRLVDPVVAINDNEDYFSSTYSLIQVALRETVGNCDCCSSWSRRRGTRSCLESQRPERPSPSARSHRRPRRSVIRPRARPGRRQRGSSRISYAT